MPLRVNLPHDRALDDGTERLNLNTVFPELQLLGMRLFDDAGLPTPTSLAVKTLINGDDPMLGGLPRVHLQPLGDEFIDDHFPPEERGANLYKKNHGDNFGWVYLGDDPDVFQASGWAKRNNSSANDWSDLADFHQLVNTPLDDPDYAATIEAGLDMDQWLRWFATHTVMGNREGGLAYRTDDDYTLYRRKKTSSP